MGYIEEINKNLQELRKFIIIGIVGNMTGSLCEYLTREMVEHKDEDEDDDHDISLFVFDHIYWFGNYWARMARQHIQKYALDLANLYPSFSIISMLEYYERINENLLQNDELMMEFMGNRAGVDPNSNVLTEPLFPLYLGSDIFRLYEEDHELPESALSRSYWQLTGTEWYQIFGRNLRITPEDDSAIKDNLISFFQQVEMELTADPQLPQDPSYVCEYRKKIRDLNLPPNNGKLVDTLFLISLRSLDFHTLNQNRKKLNDQLEPVLFELSGFPERMPRSGYADSNVDWQNYEPSKRRLSDGNPQPFFWTQPEFQDTVLPRRIKPRKIKSRGSRTK